MNYPDTCLLTELIESHLADNQRTELVTHFAGCDRCTSQLALALKLREQGEAQQSAASSTTAT